MRDPRAELVGAPSERQTPLGVLPLKSLDTIRVDPMECSTYRDTGSYRAKGYHCRVCAIITAKVKAQTARDGLDRAHRRGLRITHLVPTVGDLSMAQALKAQEKVMGKLREDFEVIEFVGAWGTSQGGLLHRHLIVVTDRPLHAATVRSYFEAHGYGHVFESIVPKARPRRKRTRGGFIECGPHGNDRARLASYVVGNGLHTAVLHRFPFGRQNPQPLNFRPVSFSAGWTSI